MEGLKALTRFHTAHGANVILGEGNTVAYRKASFANAVTLSESAIVPSEIFLVQIEKTEPGWTGHMRLGLTQIKPGSLDPKELPPYSLPDMTNMGNSWICAITKSHNRVQEDQVEGEGAVAGLLDADMETLLAAVGEGEVAGAADWSIHRRRRVSDGDQGEIVMPEGVPQVVAGIDENLSNELEAQARRLAIALNPFSPPLRAVGGLESIIYGQHVHTSRGLVPLSMLQPEPLEVTTASGRLMHLKRDNILPTDVGSRIGIIYLPRGEFAEMHYIINGEDQGAFTKKLPYKDGPLYAVVDVYGTTKQVRLIQLYGDDSVASLKSSCREIILKHIAKHGVRHLPLPRRLKDYLLFEVS